MKKTISIIIVAKNEEKVINRLFNDINKQSYPHELIDIILVDSMSVDNTLKLMNNFKIKNDGFQTVKILKNPKEILAYGWNLAIVEANTDLVVRIDAHASIPSDFLEKNIRNINNGERVSGGARPNILAPSDNGKWNETLLLAESSLFGSSIAAYRDSKEKKYVNSLFHGMYERSIFNEIGLLNTKLGRTEDNEIHFRMREAGINLLYDPEIISYQYVRSSLKKMIEQKYKNGYWVGLTLAVCPKCFSYYHFIPMAFVIGIILSLCLLPFSSLLLKLIVISYSVMAIINTVATIRGKKFNLLNCLLPFIFLLLHLSYGIGTIIGIVNIPSKKRELNSD
ncbi:glycosyltransferase family 2 protein [Enterococcus faecium]|uniref:glycosyltransferase family 2 protein n=1 Tax=Enterococcus faecium TaxID=1352 RepID=UPI000F4E2181|nr:glycosyltransferase family 2 protein [Enterococcus faecium]MDV7731922.1 glycosyltransferase family 2 protein [Enterococcus faecium]ROY96288.1 glycosyltransferase family 2 protein [Enterococcus faecium]ROY97267.1 glycosyltransferase family 2 protein [Enterococcus faecium]RXE89049.1 glycosyltransferase family 2 protein [Enterococcus faecium]